MGTDIEVEPPLKGGLRRVRQARWISLPLLCTQSEELRELAGVKPGSLTLELSWRLAGELPLSLAVCTKQWDVVTYLLENPHQPASLHAQDSLGNTVLHALVMIADDSAENSALVICMYDGLLQAGARLCPKVQLEDISNLEGLTPLKLAAKEGKIDVSGSPLSLPCLS